MTFEEVKQSELKVGDIVAPWGGRTAEIIGFNTYTGTVFHFAREARLRPTPDNGFNYPFMLLSDYQMYMRLIQ
jgi:hypothetical protein